ncbi:MAG TPA: VapC toxin family PIN domain ribonuclease, partial [Planctomycetaceae bacterium]|nr:VapC toxin family PIN domain ribonuclease [Planctomycetaceae bacterium]
MSEVVFDASALLILLNAESGAAEVAGYIPGAAINTVNLSKVIAKLAENK